MGLFDRFKKKAPEQPEPVAAEPDGATLDEEQTPIFVAITNALVEATPEWWNSATLELTAPDGVFGSGLEHSISNSDHAQDVVVATDELMEATRALELVCVRHGDSWRRCVFQIHEAGDGDWGFTANFER